jgi:hypothetical protein
VDRCLTKDGAFVINLVAAVYKMLEILLIRLVSGIVQVLKDSSHKFVLSYFKGPLGESRGIGISSEFNHKAGSLEISEVRRNVEG